MNFVSLQGCTHIPKSHRVIYTMSTMEQCAHQE